MDEVKNKEELNRELEKYKEQFTDFIEAAAHDLQAPLRKISVFIERVFTKHPNQFGEDAKEYINRIETCIEEMRSLIDGLAELAKAGAEDSFTECDLNLIAEQTLEMMREEIREKHVMVSTGPLPIVNGNIVQYKQLFKNIFENAMKFSKKDSTAKIEVGTKMVANEDRIRFNLDDGRKYYRIEVSDNGIGFNQAYAEKIFDPFVRLHPKSKYEGNGLGLSICKKIVTKHDGVIYAESNEKEGSRFVLILPETP
jgi:signal transduction histidine kinase